MELNSLAKMRGEERRGGAAVAGSWLLISGTRGPSSNTLTGKLSFFLRTQ